MDMQLGNLSSGQKDELMDQVKQQIAVANVQELLTVINNLTEKPNQIIFFILHKKKSNSSQKMTSKCFKKCVQKPGSVLDNSEQVSQWFSFFHCLIVFDM